MVHITALNKYYYGDVSKGEVVNQNLISNTASEQWLGGPALSKATKMRHRRYLDVDRRRRPPRVTSRGRREAQFHVLQTGCACGVDRRRELSSWRQGRRPP